SASSPDLIILTRSPILIGISIEGGFMARWQVQEAKMRLSQVIEEAQTKGPQMITRHGVDRAVVLSVDDYRSLSAHKPDLREYLLGGPKVDDFEIEPDRDAGREIAL